MLAIRMQRTGRKGHAQFRVIVQESRLNPSSGRVVAALGSYDPHSKVASVDTEKASFYLEHGAQPSPRVAYLLQKEGVKLPTWVKIDATKKTTIKHTDKLRRNQPKEEVIAEEPAVEAPAVEAEAETAVETTEPAETAETPVEAEAETTPEA
jgi:small subunit ribosomal protein S16